MKIDDLALASGFSAKDVARYRPMMERMVALALAEKTESCEHIYKAVPVNGDSSYGPQKAVCAKCGIEPSVADGWIPWAGGECPIPDAKAGEYMLKIKYATTYEIMASCSVRDADEWWWGDKDITAYRWII